MFQLVHFFCVLRALPRFLGDSAPKPKGSRCKACKGCSLNTLQHQLWGLNCHLVFRAGKSWVCDRDGDSGFNVWVAVTLNITRSTHIKPVGTLVPVPGISLSSHYTAFLSSSCVLSHIAALPPTKQPSSSKQVLVHKRHVAAWICLSSLLKDTVLPPQTNSGCVKQIVPEQRPLSWCRGAQTRSWQDTSNPGQHLRTCLGSWFVIWHHHPRPFKLMSACKLQQLRNQHTFASAVSPPWWPFLAER